MFTWDNVFECVEHVFNHIKLVCGQVDTMDAKLGRIIGGFNGSLHPEGSLFLYGVHGRQNACKK